MEIMAGPAAKAMQEGLVKYPKFQAFGPKLVARALFQGHALIVEYAQQPPRDDPDAWEFQNVVVKTYRKLAGA